MLTLYQHCFSVCEVALVDFHYFSPSPPIFPMNSFNSANAHISCMYIFRSITTSLQTYLFVSHKTQWSQVFYQQHIKRILLQMEYAILETNFLPISLLYPAGRKLHFQNTHIATYSFISWLFLHLHVFGNATAAFSVVDRFHKIVFMLQFIIKTWNAINTRWSGCTQIFMIQQLVLS